MEICIKKNKGNSLVAASFRMEIEFCADED